MASLRAPGFSGALLAKRRGARRAARAPLRALAALRGPGGSSTMQQPQPLPQQAPGAAAARPDAGATSSAGAVPVPADEVHDRSWYKSHFDLNLYHYLPWWLQPGTILVSGAAFFVAALYLEGEGPTWKAAAIAAGPVALFYLLALWVLPRQFQDFSVRYMRSHPELEARALSPRDSEDAGAAPPPPPQQQQQQQQQQQRQEQQQQPPGRS